MRATENHNRTNECSFLCWPRSGYRTSSTDDTDGDDKHSSGSSAISDNSDLSFKSPSESGLPCCFVCEHAFQMHIRKCTIAQQERTQSTKKNQTAATYGDALITLCS